MSPENERVRKIDISGVDKDGVLCRWTGFDKKTGEFCGIPMVGRADGNCRSTQLTGGGQKATIEGKGGK